MEVTNNQFRATADLYDLDPTFKVMEDIQFYIDRVAMYQGNILELACGTGRILILLAKTEIGCGG